MKLKYCWLVIEVWVPPKMHTPLSIRPGPWLGWGCWGVSSADWRALAQIVAGNISTRNEHSDGSSVSAVPRMLR
jgi:hypothetical protein